MPFKLAPFFHSKFVLSNKVIWDLNLTVVDFIHSPHSIDLFVFVWPLVNISCQVICLLLYICEKKYENMCLVNVANEKMKLIFVPLS